MTRWSTATAAHAATKATAAADSLMAWLRAQPGERDPIAAAAPGAEGSSVVEPLAAALMAPAAPAGALASATASQWDKQGAPLRLVHTDWLHHRLLVSGPATDLAAFKQAAAGAGTVPWQLDLGRLEEDLFHLLAAGPSRSLSLSGARILASQLRCAAAERHALALARVGHSRACPFDLHALVPVPDAILGRGPDDPEALAWLWIHWGTTEMLRHVAEDEATAAALRRADPETRPGIAIWVLTFWSADWTPWRALSAIAARWPSLRFDTRPSYDAR